MAVKKTVKKKEEPATPAKPAAKDSAKKSSTKKSAAAAPAPTPAPEASSKPAPKAAPKKSSAAAAPKAAAPKAAAPKAAAPAKAAKPKAAPVKLTDGQTEILRKIHGAGEAGYTAEKKEERTVTALLEKKLIKKGKKDKASGKTPHSVSAAGKKHLESVPPKA